MFQELNRVEIEAKVNQRILRLIYDASCVRHHFHLLILLILRNELFFHDAKVFLKMELKPPPQMLVTLFIDFAVPYDGGPPHH